MRRCTRNHCFQIFSYILVLIVFTDGQYEALNLGKKLKNHEVEYGQLLSSIETGPREQLTSIRDTKVIMAFASSGEGTAGAQEDQGTEATDPLFTTKCTTDKAIEVDGRNLPTSDGSDVIEDPIEPSETTEEPDEPIEEPSDSPTEDPIDDITNNEVDTTEKVDTEPPTTKAYDGPKKTHVPDHYVDDI